MTGKDLEDINVPNHFADISVDGPRVLGAIMKAVKSGYIGGPYKESEVELMASCQHSSHLENEGRLEI